MNEDYIRDLLEKVSAGSVTAEDAFGQLKDLPYKDLGFANVDHHRAIRTGFPEVIFGQGKTPEQIRDIFKELIGHGRTIMATRASVKAYQAVGEAVPQAQYYETARIIAVREEPAKADVSCAQAAANAQGTTDAKKAVTQDAPALGSVCVVSAGTADIPVAEEAAVTAELLGNEVSRVYDVGVAGIHRLFDKLPIIRQADVVITVAGMEGALASVIGGLVDVPVIAVPTSIGYGANLGGLSALLSMLNSCANGVSVVNIDNGFGAAYMAAVINKGHRR
ncbi:MAG: nickel pincer cofactor biosynthesis protein LarB [Firmicutes bacterium]|nr:nickel pincer cofactor biosynthesis protein LarB [Bacillota bacterium]